MATDRRSPRKPLARRNGATAVVDAPRRGDACVAPTTPANIEFDGDLPEGWAAQRLGHLLQSEGLFDGPFGSELKTADYTDAGVRVIRLENLGNLRFHAEKRTFVSHQKYSSLARHTVREGDILFGSFVDASTRVCVLPKLDTKAIAKADCFCIRPRADTADPGFLALQLATNQVRDGLREQIHGATRPRVTTRQLRELVLALPPLREQKRIVAKVEEVLAHVNAARDHLARVPALLKRFRQSVLASACSGRLTEDWRARRTVERASAILELAESDVAGLPDIPASWIWTIFDRLIRELKNGIPTRPALDPPGRPILRISAVRPGAVHLDDVRFLRSREDVDQYGLADGDLLFTRYNGTLDLLGICATVRGLGQRELVYPDKLIRARLNADNVLPEYAEFYFQAPETRDRVTAVAKSSAGQHGISGKDLRSQPFALPSVAEQHEIVRRVDALFALAGSIEQRVADANVRANALTQATLAKAFRGDLVTTEAELARRGRPHARVTGNQRRGTPA